MINSLFSTSFTGKDFFNMEGIKGHEVIAIACCSDS